MSEDILQNNHRSEEKEVIHEGEVCLLENVEILLPTLYLLGSKIYL